MDTQSILLIILFLTLILFVRAFVLRVEVELFNWMYKNTKWVIPVPGFGLAVGTELTEMLSCLFVKIIFDLIAVQLFYPDKPAFVFMATMGTLFTVNVMTFIRTYMLEIDSWQALALTLIDLVGGLLLVGIICLAIFCLVRLQIV